MALDTDHFSKEIFKTSKGFMYLGGFIGAANDTKEYIGKKVDNWFNSEKLFSNISVK